MSQTSYAINTDAAYAGQLGDVGPHDIGSGTDLTANEYVPFGVAVSQGTKDGEIHLPAASGDVTAKFLGVSVAQQTNENLVGTGGSYAPKVPVSFLKKGRVWVKVEEAVTPASPVFVRFAAGGGGTQLGAFRASADTATAVALPGGAKFVTSAGAAGFALLDLNYPY
jgi:hypothetical protein